MKIGMVVVDVGEACNDNTGKVYLRLIRGDEATAKCSASLFIRECSSSTFLYNPG
jgi:hypothetical protein